MNRKAAGYVSLMFLMLITALFILQPNGWTALVAVIAFGGFLQMCSPDPQIEVTQKKLDEYGQKIDEFAAVMNNQAKAIETLKAAIAMRTAAR